MRILVLTKRQYMSKDLLDDRFGRFREIPFELARKGHIVRGICLSYTYRNEGWFSDGSVRWKSINADKLKAIGLIRYLITTFILAKKSDVIWACSDSFYGVIGCWVSQIYGIPVVFDIYDNFGEFCVAKIPLVKQLYHWAVRRSDAITCLSQAFKEYIQERFHRREGIYPIEFAVRTDLFHPMDKISCRRLLGLPSEAFIIGTAGELTPKRDVHLLIEAFLQLKRRHSSLHLALAGPLAPGLVIPEDPQLHYLGKLPFEKVPMLNNALDIAIVCYADDDFGKYCFPQKTREFMACDRPVVAANVGSLKNLFRETPQWLYIPGSAKSLSEVLERRMFDLSTRYPSPTTWADLAAKIERIMKDLQSKNGLRR